MMAVQTESEDLLALKNRITDCIHSKTPSCLALADLDFFANISGRIGSAESARAIESVMKYFTAYWCSEKPENSFFRYADDEFALVLGNMSQTRAKEKLAGFRKAFRGQKFIGGESVYSGVPVTLSVGVTSLENRTNLSSALKMAETALLMAKKLGRNRVETAPEPEAEIIYDRSAAVSTLAGTTGISQPYGVEVDNENRLIVADRGNHRIVRMNNGRIEEFAGCGQSGFDETPVSATEARLCKPSGAAVDSFGDLIIADTGNNAIRVVDTSGIMRTLAGGGKPGYTGDGGRAVNALLNRPGGVAADAAGNVYTNDYGNNVIRRISHDGVIETIIGSGEYGTCRDGDIPRLTPLNKPYGLAVTPDGTVVYLADYGTHRILAADLIRNRMVAVCGTGKPGYSGDGGPGRSASLYGPYWISLYRGGHLFIADSGNQCIRSLDLRTGMISTIAGNGSRGYADVWENPREATFNIPAGMAIDQERKVLYIADYANNAIRRVKL